MDLIFIVIAVLKRDINELVISIQDIGLMEPIKL